MSQKLGWNFSSKTVGQLWAIKQAFCTGLDSRLPEKSKAYLLLSLYSLLVILCHLFILFKASELFSRYKKESHVCPFSYPPHSKVGLVWTQQEYFLNIHVEDCTAKKQQLLLYIINWIIVSFLMCAVIFFPDLKWVNVTNSEEACKILKVGNKNRSLACTKMNQQSSRRFASFNLVLLFLLELMTSHAKCNRWYDGKGIKKACTQGLLQLTL